MKIKQVRIQNLRSFERETIEFDEYTAFVGPNGAGKSNILFALNLFFREGANTYTPAVELTTEDFHRGRVQEPAVVELTFCDLSDNAATDLSHYVRHGELVVRAVATYVNGKITVEHFGSRMGMNEFVPFFAARSGSAKAPELQGIYGDLRNQYPELPTWRSMDAAGLALNEYEKAHPDLCVLLDSPAQFYGFQGKGKLDPHVQYVFVPAVKEAGEEEGDSRNSALGKLLDRTVRAALDFSPLDNVRATAVNECQAAIDAEAPKLQNLSKKLQASLARWTASETKLDLGWAGTADDLVKISTPSAAIKLGDNDIMHSVRRMGHGMQRSFLMMILQELAQSGQVSQPSLILAIEEPELYQHPPQARHLARILRSCDAANQTIVTTHSPIFVDGEYFEGIRRVYRSPDTRVSKCARTTIKEIHGRLKDADYETTNEVERTRTELHQVLQPQLNEIFFSPIVVLAEGMEDLAYLATFMERTDRWKEFAALGMHIVASDGKGRLIRPLAVCQALSIPTFVVFDADGDVPDVGGKRNQHAKDNTAILKLLGVTKPAPFPDDDVFAERHISWRLRIGDAVSTGLIKGDMRTYEAEAKKKHGHVRDNKDALIVSSMVEDMIGKGEPLECLAKAADVILAFGRGIAQNRSVGFEEAVVMSTNEVRQNATTAS